MPLPPTRARTPFLLTMASAAETGDTYTNPNTAANSAQSQNSDDARAELTARIDDLINMLSNKFAGVSSEIFAKMDEMARRLDNLEAQLMPNTEKS